MSLLNELKRRNVLRVAAAYTVSAWLLIQVSETIFPLFGFDDTPARIVVIVLAIGFIPTLIFAWAFELTPEGVKKEKDVDRSQSITPHTGKKLDHVIMVILALALGYFAIDKFVLEPQREAAHQQRQAEQLATVAEQSRQEGRTEALVGSYGDKSIAVLPFVNMSDDAGNEYFSDGISEELLNLLARVPELRVISRSSAFSFKDQNLEIPEIANRLNVAHVLEGSVRKAGNQVRITAQLIDARSDTHLWSATYDRTLDDIFAIQDEVAASVVGKLKVTLLGKTPHVQETDPEAYALYLQARYLNRQYTAEGYEQANDLYRQALAIDPGYAAAWDNLGKVYIDQAGIGPRSVDEDYTLAREMVEKALAIDSDYAPAHANLGWIAIYHDRDLAAAARHFERALELDPANPLIIRGAAGLFGSLGRLEQAIALNKFVISHDPVNPAGHYNMGINYYLAGQWDEAIASLRTALRLSPGYIGAGNYLSRCLLFKGDPEAALATVQPNMLEGARLEILATAYHALGDAPASNAALGEFIKKYGTSWPFNIALVLAYRNETDRAFEWLNKSIEYGDWLSPIYLDPMFNNLHDDPRWLPLLESIGDLPAQLDMIEFNVTLPK